MTTHPSFGDESSEISRFAFFCGKDMDPIAIRRRPGFEKAQFVSIGSTRAAEPVMPDGLAHADIWGIVIRVPADAELPEAPHIPVTLREGTTILAAILTTPESAGTSADILAQARYWELPVPYRNRIEALL